MKYEVGYEVNTSDGRQGVITVLDPTCEHNKVYLVDMGGSEHWFEAVEILSGAPPTVSVFGVLPKGYFEDAKGILYFHKFKEVLDTRGLPEGVRAAWIEYHREGGEV